MSEKTKEAKRKARKRADGEGALDQLPSGLWRGRVTVGRDWKTGTLKRKTITGQSQGEVIKKMEELKQQVRSGVYSDDEKMMFAQWLDIWLEEYAKPVIRPSTYDLYEYLIRLHIKPGVGGFLLKELQPFHIQRFYNNKAKEKKRPRTKPKTKEKENELIEKSSTLSPTTIRHMHVVINRALGQALKEGRIPRNPADATSPPKLVKKEAAYLSIEEINTLLNRIKEEPWFEAFLTVLGTGVRVGELVALKWKNVHFEKSYISIKNAAYRVKTYAKKGPKTKEIYQQPKSEKGRRDIPLPDNVAAELRKLKAKQAQEKLMLGEAYQGEGDKQEEWFVFTWPDGRNVDSSYLSKRFKKIVEKMGRKDVTFHGLRHSYASALLATGEHPKVVQELLGHAQISMTLDTYSHVAPDLKEKAAQKMNSILHRKNPSSAQEGK